MAAFRLDRAAFMTDSGVSTRIGVNGTAASALTWTSSDPTVAAVSADGVVTACRKGEAIITASTGTGDAAECRVTVDRTGQNPLLPPTWGMFIADGEPHVFDGRVYIYGSRDTPNGWNAQGFDWCSDNYHVIWSDDLIHWTDAGESISLATIPPEVKGDSTRLWAPDCFFDPKTEKYYLFSCTNKGRPFVAESDSPTGPFVNARLLTMNGKPFEQIDPGVLEDGGKVYLVLPKFAVMQLDPEDYSRVLPETYTPAQQWMDTENDPFEGPSIRKYGDLYYYIYIKNHGHVATNGAFPTSMGYMTAAAPLGPYADRGVIAENHEYLHAGNIHGSLCEFRGQRYVFHHMPFADLQVTRTMFGEPVHFREDGSIEQAVITSCGCREAFRVGDEIEACSAAAYSGGRDDMRCISRTERDPQDPNIVTAVTGLPYVVFRKAGDGVTYRYMDFPGKALTLSLRVRTEAAGGVLALCADGRTLAELPLPDTGKDWRDITFPLAPVKGRLAFDLVLHTAPAAGEAALESFAFLPAD